MVLKDYGGNIADCARALETMMLMTNALDLGSIGINPPRGVNENSVIIDKIKELGMADDEKVGQPKL